jgi:hypothetical protein
VESILNDPSPIYLVAANEFRDQKKASACSYLIKSWRNQIEIVSESVVKGKCQVATGRGIPVTKKLDSVQI